LDLNDKRPSPSHTEVLTVHVAGLRLARLFALVEGELSGKEVLSTLVIERLLRRKRKRKRRRRKRGDGTTRGGRGRRGGRMWVWMNETHRVALTGSFK